MQNKEPQNQLKLPLTFYTRNNVLLVAKELLGKLLVTHINHVHTSARIVETEAYNGIIDQASHAFGGRKTSRTLVMYASGGTAYVYLCYGIHHLFNVVTNEEGIPHAVLIRAAEPVAGLEEMLLRTGKTKLDFTLTKGPGNVSKALGITTQLTGFNLMEDIISIVDDGYVLKDDAIISTPRIGVDYAKEDAVLPYRFIVKNNPYVSGKNNKLF